MTDIHSYLEEWATLARTAPVVWEIQKREQQHCIALPARKPLRTLVKTRGRSWTVLRSAQPGLSGRFTSVSLATFWLAKITVVDFNGKMALPANGPHFTPPLLRGRVGGGGGGGGGREGHDRVKRKSLGRAGGLAGGLQIPEALGGWPPNPPRMHR
jgi:hypothetical protein